MSRAVLIPGVLALLPEYAGLEDPVADLRAACARAVAWAAETGPVSVLGSPQGRRVALSLLTEGGLEARAQGDGLAPRPPVVAVGNGSAKRTEQAPGHVDDRAVPFDAALGAAIARGRLGEVDLALAEELWADVAAISELARVLPPGLPGSVDYDAAPFGVQYWVARWEW